MIPNASYWSISSLLVVGMTILSLLSEGSHSYMSGNDSYAMPVICQKNNPELYPKDEHVHTMARAYLTYYYDALYWISSLSDIKPACLMLHISTRLLFFSAIFLLSISLFSRHEIAWISMLMFVLPKSLYGNTLTISPTLFPEQLAAALLLVGLSCLFRKQIVVFAVILSGLLYVRAMTVIWGVLIGFFCWLGNQGYKHVRQSGLALILGAIIALPFLYQYCQKGLNSGGLILTREQMESFARWLIASHIFPLSWGLMNNIIKLSAICGIAVLGYLGARKRPDLLRMLVFVAVGTLLIWSAGFIFAEVHYLPVMNKMQLFRSSSIELILFSVFLGNFIWTKGSEYLARHNYLAIVVLLIGLLFLSLKGVRRFTLLGVVVMGLSIFISHQKTNMLIGIMIAKLSRECRNYFWSRKWLVPAVLIVMSGLAIYGLGYGMIRYCQKTKTVSEPLQEAALWARTYTPLDALFVTPPLLQGFRYWSQRSQLPDWKDGGIGAFDAAYTVFFLEVMKAYGFRPGMDFSYLAGVSGEQIISVGHQFGVDYALLPKVEPALPIMTVFTNNQWRIVRLN